MGKRKQRSGSKIAGKQKESQETAISQPTPSTSTNRPVQQPRGKSKNETSLESITDKASSAPVVLPPMRMRTRGMAAIESGQGNAPNSSKSKSTTSKPKIVPVRVGGQEQKKQATEQSDLAPKIGRRAKQELGTTSSRFGASVPAIDGTSKSKKTVLSRAELIQLEAEQIPSVKTSTWNPFTLFPKEIWEIIFNNLANPKDMESVINSTPEWRQMYLPKRTILLFPQVLSLMADTQFGDYDDDNYLLRDDYINCRLVNRSWDQSVQNYIQNHPIHYTLDSDMLLDYKIDTMIDKLERFPHHWWQGADFDWQYSLEGMDFLLRDFAPSHPPTRNPFLCRQINLRDGMDARWTGHEYQAPDLATTQLVWSNVTNVLEKYGSHVWHCIIDYKWNLTPLTWYVHMHHWISLLSNLKTLDLQYSCTSIGASDLTELANQIAVHPISTLNNLILLKTEDVPGPVFNELIRNAPNLQKLQIKLRGRNTGVRLCHYDLARLSNHQLTEACLTLVAPEDFRHCETTLPSWPLKTLYIDLGFEGDFGKTQSYPTWPNWNGIFGMVSDKFGSSLTKLKLRLPKASSDKDRKRILSDSLQYRLNLPHLEKLRVYVPNLSSFDFLLSMKSSLEKLVLVVDHVEYEDGRKRVINKLKRNETLKFTGNFATLLNSNVFEEFPKLKNMQLHALRKFDRPGQYLLSKYDLYEY